MMLLGVDYHLNFEQIAFFREETGECGEWQLNHSEGKAERFYRDPKQRGIRVRVGMEATGYSRWFERLLAELDFELWIGYPAEIKAKRIKKQKTDRKDAQLLLRLMLNENSGDVMVRKGGFEPPRLAAPPPQDGASASSATSALEEINEILAASRNARKKTLGVTSSEVESEPVAAVVRERPESLWAFRSCSWPAFGCSVARSCPVPRPYLCAAPSPERTP
jgi:hypothetical protein